MLEGDLEGTVLREERAPNGKIFNASFGGAELLQNVQVQKSELEVGSCYLKLFLLTHFRTGGT